jgi:long-chain acyl-CoA synthetase
MQENGSTAARPWFQHYPAGVPHRIDEASSATIVDILRNAARDYATRPAAESFGVRLTYAQMMQHAE